MSLAHEARQHAAKHLTDQINALRTPEQPTVAMADVLNTIDAIADYIFTLGVERLQGPHSDVLLQHIAEALLEHRKRHPIKPPPPSKSKFTQRT